MAYTFQYGVGSASDPYQIWTVDDLNVGVREYVTGSKYFKQMADIDLTGLDWVPLGATGVSTYASFRGTYDGNGKKIKNLYISAISPYKFRGLFSYMANATIKNLFMENVNILCDLDTILPRPPWNSNTNSVHLTGGLVGSIGGSSAALIINCRVSGYISSVICGGGLVGSVEESGGVGIYGCLNESHVVVVAEQAGGIIGRCSSLNTYAGGWCTTTIKDCYNTGDIDTVAGIDNYYGLSWHYSWAGGMVGLVDTSSLTIERCYNIGNMPGYLETGGIVGYKYTKYTDPVITNSYFTSLPDNGYGTYMSDSQMRSKDTYIGWDHNIWAFDTDYPRIIHFLLPKPANPIEVWTLDDLEKIRNNPNWDYTQMADIDLVGMDWDPIGQKVYWDTYNDGFNYFQGKYDGNGFAIDNLTIDREQDKLGGGLFDNTKNAILENITLNDVSIRIGGYNSTYVGSLAGRTDGGRINNCHVTGSVESTIYSAAGLVGYSQGDIDNCSFEGTVIGVKMVGGLVGFGWVGEITDCHCIGDVMYTGSGYSCGGLVAEYYGNSISNCHHIGGITAPDCSGVGGLIGCCYTYTGGGLLISDCYHKGTVSGSGYIGGLIGELSPSVYTQISGCYNDGPVIGASENVGGLIGYCSDSSTTKSYSIGDVSGNLRLGGLVGTLQDSVVTDCYTISNVSVTDGACGGFIGELYSAQLTNCYCKGTITNNPTTISDWAVLNEVNFSMASDDTGIYANPQELTEDNPYYNPPFDDGVPAMLQVGHVLNEGITGDFEINIDISFDASGMYPSTYTMWQGFTMYLLYNNTYDTMNKQVLIYWHVDTRNDITNPDLPGRLKIEEYDPSVGETGELTVKAIAETPDTMMGVLRIRRTGSTWDFLLDDTLLCSYEGGSLDDIGYIEFYWQAGSNNLPWTPNINKINNFAISTQGVFDESVGGFGGVVGTSTFTSCYYDSEVSGLTDTGKGEPRTTAEMRTRSNYVNWDFSTPVWIIVRSVNDGYPTIVLGGDDHLLKVNKPKWVGYSIIWEDVPDANSYEVTLYRNGEVASIKTVPSGVQFCDFSAVLLEGTYTATVRAMPGEV